MHEGELRRGERKLRRKLAKKLRQIRAVRAKERAARLALGSTNVREENKRDADFDAGVPDLLAAWRAELLRRARRDFFDAGVLAFAHETRGQHPLPHVLKWNLAMIMSLNAGRSEHEGSMRGCSGSSGGTARHDFAR